MVHVNCTVDQADPYGQVAGQHFNELLRRYGSRIIVLDLVKVRSSVTYFWLLFKLCKSQKHAV